MTTTTKNPYATMFWNDLENDEKLKTCSLAAKGLWAVHMLPMAARAPEPGVVMSGEHPCRWDDDLPIVLATAAGANATPEVLVVMATVFRDLIKELVTSGTASVDGQGRMYNRRMVREARMRAQKSAAGQAGMEARWGKRTNSTPDNRPITEPLSGGITETRVADGQQNLDLQGENARLANDPGYQTDNGSITSSLLPDSKTPRSGESLTEDRGRASRSKTGGRRTKLPEDWQPSPELLVWTRGTISATNAVDRINVDIEIQKFRAHHIARGNLMSKWDRAWHTWIFNAIEWSDPNGIKKVVAKGRTGQRTSAVQVRAAFATELSRSGDRGSTRHDGGAQRRDGDGARTLDDAELVDTTRTTGGGS